MACEEGRAEIAVTLVENGANLYIQNKVSQGPYIQYNSSFLSEKIKGCLTIWHAVQETDYMTNNKTNKQSGSGQGRSRTLFAVSYWKTVVVHI